MVVFLESVAPRAAGLANNVTNTDIGSLNIWWMDGMESPWCRPTELPLREVLHAACRYLRHSFGATISKFQWPLDMARAKEVWANKKIDEEKDKSEPPLASDMKNREGSANLVEEWLRWVCGRGRHILPVLVFASLNTRPHKSDRFNWKNIQTYFLDKLGHNGVLVVPVLPLVAPFHGELLCSWNDINLNGIFNATEMPSTAVPLGLTKDGFPLGLQVVATPGNDHLSLAVAAALEEEFGGWVSPSPVSV
ncbi:fatty-acid amide hydrolase 2-B-like isoform X3 [Portunus trituberculatus]|uniref:fatty-acid amide hydrolase 2-B-like isoform X3 n=1 Tax=Portunus trituberculatus TaxID=210409 RepID=UPI001E1D0542|nr:fatty-acid amide hydrolase 2-B-like isoform X3 [Portunus trituberculatus]